VCIAFVIHQLREATANINVPQKPNTDPFELELERSMERSSSALDHELDNTAAHSNYLKKEERAKSSLTHKGK